MSPLQDRLATLTDANKRALLRFRDTCADGEGYDISKQQRQELSRAGLIRHCGGGYYESCGLFDEVCEALDAALAANAA
jgi:hypothetical protein